MARFVRRHWNEEDIWFYLELDDDGWVTRHLELQGSGRVPIVAASLQEWMRELDAGRIQQYQTTYGVVAEVPLAPDELIDWQVVSVTEFEKLWREARGHLEG
ncbi:hypothetical protein GCM10027280_38970 [Micromonospora polyrhachis]|uniref:Uncharacterized protein n=1 Tax=Micromonospora polyrhachis TaxID=1282883 RepID=A0A7W7SRP8_9ACTN|nr:hypothetical protein [Micromonospora polyrhachis]MBB4959752.1 hypothetical protein [Micromonospora polyrhachis]